MSGILWLYGHFGIAGCGWLESSRLPVPPLAILGMVPLLFVSCKTLGEAYLYSFATLFTTGLFVVVVRGAPFLDSAVTSHEDVFHEFFGHAAAEGGVLMVAGGSHDVLAHKSMLVKMARLGVAGWWTGRSRGGGLVHLLGLAACLFNGVRIFTGMRVGGAGVTKHDVLVGMPALYVPIVLCGRVLQIQLLGSLVFAVSLFACVWGIDARVPAPGGAGGARRSKKKAF